VLHSVAFVAFPVFGGRSPAGAVGLKTSVFVVCRIALLLKTKDKLGSNGNFNVDPQAVITRIFMFIIRISRIEGGFEFSSPAVSVARRGGEAIRGLRFGPLFSVWERDLRCVTESRPRVGGPRRLLVDWDSTDYINSHILIYRRDGRRDQTVAMDGIESPGLAWFSASRATARRASALYRADGPVGSGS
jgi:hypothetical protein